MYFYLLLKLQGKNIGKNISKNLSNKYNQKVLDHAKKFETDALKTSSKWVIQKTAEALGDLISSKIDVKITKLSTNSQKKLFRNNFKWEL